MFPSKSNGSPPPQGKMYQIDFTAVASGKRIASSKRRVRWRFGFANLDSLEAGQTGTDCRGEEHDVTIVWSITSGKRLVLADGKEVHFSHSRNNVFDFSWTMRGNHVLKVVAHAQPPMSAQPGFRQYDFFVDGQSFFTFPKVFRLGLAPNDLREGRSGKGGASSSNRSQQNMNMAERRVVQSERSNGYNNYGGNVSGSGGGNITPYVNSGVGGGGRSVSSNNIVSIESPHNPEEEDAYLRQAIENSLKESPPPNRPSVTNSIGGAAPPEFVADTLLLDFMAPATAPTLALPSSTSSYASHMYGTAVPIVHEQQPAYAALPSSTTATSNTAVTNVPYPSQQQQQQDPWGMGTITAALPPSQLPTSQLPPANQFYGGGSAPAQLVSDQFGGTVSEKKFPTPFSPPPPSLIAREEFTPGTQASSIGFASPMMAETRRAQEQQEGLGVNGMGALPQLDKEQKSKDSSGFAEQQSTGTGAELSNFNISSAAPFSNPALRSMDVLSDQPQSLVTESMTNGDGDAAGVSMADQAYAKLVNMDAFDLVQDKDTESRINPFEMAGNSSTAIVGHSNTASLADIMKSKNPAEKKEIMKSQAPAAPGALVLSNNQQGNFGNYGPQYSTAGSASQMQDYGRMYGGGMQQQAAPPPMHQHYGQQQIPPPSMHQHYGQQQIPPPMHQHYGQQQIPPPPMRQQYGQYGQQPPITRQQYGQHETAPQPMQQPFAF